MRKENTLYNLIKSNGNLGEIALVLRPLQKGALEDWVLKVCIYKQAGVSTRIPEPDTLINASAVLGLVEIRKRKKNRVVSLSRLGKNIVRLKTVEKDRLTKQQGKIIFSIALEKMDIIDDVLSVINMFNIYQNGDFRISSNDNRINYLEDQILRLFQQLKIATYQNGNIIVEKKDKEWLIALISSIRETSIDELLDLLTLKRKYGIMAEDFVLRKEKERLVKIGRMDLASLVKKISDQNISAGYDILSFDGCKSSLIPDRFIEVKGSSNNQLVFYISKNEIQIAQKMQDKYWIYCVLGVGNPTNQKIEIINNPYKRIFQEKQFNIEPILWRISEKR